MRIINKRKAIQELNFSFGVDGTWHVISGRRYPVRPHIPLDPEQCNLLVRLLRGMTQPKGNRNLKRKLARLAFAMVLGIVATGFAKPAKADIYTAGCTNNVGDVSDLIAKINAANATPVSDIINLGANCVYTLKAVDNWWYGPNGLPPISSEIIIEGNGAIIERDNTAQPVRLRFFYIGADPVNNPFSLDFNTPGAGILTLRNLTLKNGRQQGGDGGAGGGGGAGMGGAIFNQGKLSLDNVTFMGNTALGGSGKNGSGEGGGGIGGSDGFGGDVLPSGSQGGGGGGGDFGKSGTTKIGGGGGGFGIGDNGDYLNGGGKNNGLGGPSGYYCDTAYGYTYFCTSHGYGGNGSGGSNTGYQGYYYGNGGRLKMGGSYYGFYFENGGGGGIGGGGGGGKGYGHKACYDGYCFFNGYRGYGGGGGFGGGGGSGQGIISEDMSSGAHGGGGGFGGGGGGFSTIGSGGTGGFGGGSGMALFGGGGAGLGGAIFNHIGTITISKSSFIGNSAVGGNGGIGGSGFGAALFNLNGKVKIINSSIAGNTIVAGTGSEASGSAGGAIYNLGYDGNLSPVAKVTLQNSPITDTVGGKGLVNKQPAKVAGDLTNNAKALVSVVGSPSIVSLTPALVTSAAGSPQVFSAIYGHTDGYVKLKTVDFLVGTPDGVNAIWLRYHRGSNMLYMYNDVGTGLLTKSCTPGGVGKLSNSQGTLNCASTSVATSDKSLKVKWNITPKSGFVSASAKAVRLTATDKYGASTGGVEMGSWTIIPTNTAPAVGTLTPDVLTSQAGEAQMLTAVYGDPDGYANLKNVELRVGPAGGVSAIWLRYDRGNNKLYMYNDAGTGLLTKSCTPGGVGKLSNTQGSLNCASTSVTVAGNDLTVGWNITPKSGFAASTAKKVSMKVTDNSKATSGWVLKGSWKIEP